MNEKQLLAQIKEFEIAYVMEYKGNLKHYDSLLKQLNEVQK